MIMGSVMALVIFMIGWIKYDGTTRMVSTDSRAISAACHTLITDRDGYLLPVTWGVLEIERGVGRCAFTTATDAKHLETGGLYR
jgi:hypothetical protein